MPLVVLGYASLGAELDAIRRVGSTLYPLTLEVPTPTTLEQDVSTNAHVKKFFS